MLFVAVQLIFSAKRWWVRRCDAPVFHISFNARENGTFVIHVVMMFLRLKPTICAICDRHDRVLHYLLWRLAKHNSCHFIRWGAVATSKAIDNLIKTLPNSVLINPISPQPVAYVVECSNNPRFPSFQHAHNQLACYWIFAVLIIDNLLRTNSQRNYGM